MKTLFYVNSVNDKYPVCEFTSKQDFLEYINTFSDPWFLIDENILKKYTFVKEFTKDRMFAIHASEESKNLSKVDEICEWLISNGAKKSSTLIGIGGGVIQDLSTFVSHIYYRGIPWHFIPTTLLSQADSCIGAKCALNSKKAKNQIGVIHTPKSVLIMNKFLETLPESEIKSGFGEILKLSVTGPNQFFTSFKQYLEERGTSNLPNVEIVISSLKAKLPIIEADEYENDLRRILNYGHSFGHALETISSSRIVHGDAVVFGMDLINYIGLKLDITKESFYTEFKKVIRENFKHIAIPKDLASKELIAELKHDKKVIDNVINFAIPVEPGSISIFPFPIDLKLSTYVDEYLQNHEFATY